MTDRRPEEAMVGRIVTPIVITNPLDPSKEIRCDILVDTGAANLVLPSAWRSA